MSEFSIKQYQNEVEKIIHFGGTKKEREKEIDIADFMIQLNWRDFRKQ